MAELDIERRVTLADTAVEYRCECEKTGRKRPVIVGHAAVFRSESRNLGGFIESIHPEAFNKVLATNPDVLGVYNHDKNILLARTGNGSLKLNVDERGLRYEMSLPNTTHAADVAELVREGLVVGSSFAFAIDRDGGDSWSAGPDGIRRREIRSISLLEDVGPVARPAYNASSVVVSRRALETALGEAYRPNVTMANAAKRGMKASERHDVESRLACIAERIAAREIITPEEIEVLRGVQERCLAAKSAKWSGTLPWVEWQLAGGDSGLKWVARHGEWAQESRAEKMPEPEPEEMGDDDEPAGTLSPENFALYEAIEKIAVENGPWEQSGPAGAHYIADNPFAEGGIRCQNCVFWNEGGSCDVVSGKIDPNAICKLWVIPEEQLAAKPEEARSENATGVDLKPTEAMASAAKRGLKLHEEGKSGDGLKPETVARANKLARREEMNEAWVREMNAWFARHESASKSPGWNTTGDEKPGFVAWLLWGGDAAQSFAKRKVAELDKKGARSVQDDHETAAALARLKAIALESAADGRPE